MNRFRTIAKAYADIHEQDPNSAISMAYIRQLVMNKEVDYLKSGNRYLVNMDSLEETLKENSEH